MIRLQQLKGELAAYVIGSGAWQRWQQLPPRDRLALTLLGVFFTLLLFYSFIWLPLDRKLDSASARYRQEREFLDYLQEQAPILRNAAKDERASLAPEQLQGLITSSAQKRGLVLERLDSEGNGRLLVSLAQAPFESMIVWLGEIEKKGVKLLEISLERSGVGQVDARLTFGVDMP